MKYRNEQFSDAQKFTQADNEPNKHDNKLQSFIYYGILRNIEVE